MHSCIRDRLLFICENKNLKLKDFQEITQLPYRTAQSYLNGTRTPNTEGLMTICTRLCVNLNWLIAGIGEPFFSSEPEQNAVDFVCTPDEQLLVENFRKLDGAGKTAITATMSALLPKSITENNQVQTTRKVA